MMRLRVCVCSMLVATVCLLSAMPALGQNASSQADDSANAPRISLPEFKALLAHGNVLVLDVRDADSYKAGHIPGAVLLPLAEIGQHIGELKAEKRPIVTYCAWPAEHTSARAALELRKKGITNVRALKGGIHQWQNEGNPTVKGMGAK